ncbi:aromatic ring-opening dioxygenase family protein [Melanomma pulvis-pyrius CBS 109.77]|uniref:Aromatic ring-opening dioxygenase family protein n=1 Tax=Melanomma pulvis-pyrius CBS 109.77 TaxID=1314802 RepID=A0A6A6XPG7_9PLEO|nr:aromatic ring-opening dioxygenase family protein [Melanomma pulvis-pyrius CBS 109.77]
MVISPVHFFSHGSTMMLGEDSESADYWKQCGDEALAHGIKGIVMMVRKYILKTATDLTLTFTKGAHWACVGQNKVEVSMNPNPGKSPVALVHPSKYLNYKLVPDLESGKKCIDILAKDGFDVIGNENFNWIHDTYLILIRMFPKKCPPTTIISLNARFEPHFHMRIGAALRQLREQGYLLIGTGGAVHNLYRNVWQPMIKYSDNFAQESPPGDWAMEFRQAVDDAISGNSGPELRRAVTRLMKHPRYRDAHATDDHFMAAAFIAGAAGSEDDNGKYGNLGAETWELTNMCNSQFTIGAYA